MSLQFREKQPKKISYIGKGTVIVFRNKYIITQISDNNIRLLNLMTFKLEGRVVVVENTDEITREEFDTLIQGLSYVSTMSDWTFYQFNGDYYKY